MSNPVIKEALPCYECGDAFTEDNQPVLVKGLSYCEDCAPIGKVDCHECSDTIDYSDSIVIEGTSYCSDCVSLCDNCNDNTLNDSIGTVNIRGYSSRTAEWCESCRDNDAFYCDNCSSTCNGERTDMGYNTYCERCTERNLTWCDRCDEYHHNDDDCPNRRGSCDTREHRTTPQVGVATARFGLRTVGIEIETGEGATDASFADPFESQFMMWGYKEDGSLNDGGMELVSPPLGGDTIGTQFQAVYTLLRREGVDMTDQDAGTHIHVDYRDTRNYIGAEAGKGNEAPLDAFIQWGQLVTSMVRMLVEPERTRRDFCESGFGSRCYHEMGQHISKKLPNKGYAAVAVRENTIEFRIWSVTGSAEVSMARAEFSQKSVDFLYKLVTSTPAIRKSMFTRMTKALIHLRLGALAPLATAFGLSKECVTQFKPYATKAMKHRASWLKHYGNLPQYDT